MRHGIAIGLLLRSRRKNHLPADGRGFRLPLGVDCFCFLDGFFFACAGISSVWPCNSTPSTLSC